MEVIETELEGLYLFKCDKNKDKGGIFEQLPQLFCVKEIDKSYNNKGVLRGLHFQKPPYTQNKIIRCNSGKAVEIVLDIRKDSKTYGKHLLIELRPTDMIYIPKGFACGFLSLKDGTSFDYISDNNYNPKYIDTISYTDPYLKIDLKDYMTRYNIKKPIMTEEDENAKKLIEIKTNFFKTQKKFLVTGAKGQLGHDVSKLLEDLNLPYLACDRTMFDITNKEETINAIKEYNPDVIIHCAAYTNVDLAEIESDLAYKINVLGTKNVNEAAKLIGAKIIYLSTDYIFDGTKDGLYTEEDIPNPLNVYGKTKYLGEKEIMTNPKHFIMRISWVFGINGKNFIKTMLKLSKKYDSINVVDDQIGSPTYTKDLARKLIEIAYTDKYGIYNITNDNYCSWAFLANYIMEKNDKKTKINPIDTEEYMKSKLQAERPRNSKLSKEKLEKTFGKLRPYEDALDEFFDELNKPNQKSLRLKPFE